MRVSKPSTSAVVVAVAVVAVGRVAVVEAEVAEVAVAEVAVNFPQSHNQPLIRQLSEAK